MKVPLFYVALGVLAAALLQLFLMSIPLRLRVLSASMEPTLYGPHWDLVCPKCGGSFMLSADAFSSAKIENARFASCPVCGFSEIQLQPKKIRKGDTVKVARSGHPRPARWETVAFRLPGEGKMAVKRVAGLPGEVVELRRGTLYVNGQPVPKPRAGWSRVSLRTVRKAEPGKLIFLNNIPYPVLEGEQPGAAWVPVPVTNVSTTPSLEEPAGIEFVNDYTVGFPGLYLKQGSIILNQGDRAWLVGRDPEYEALSLRRLVFEKPDPQRAPDLEKSDFDTAERYTCGLPADGWELFLSCADGFLTLTAGDQELCRLPNPPVSERSLPVTCPLVLLTETPEDYIPARFHIWRDTGYGNMPERHLADDEYFLLGDNPSVSVDSRTRRKPVRRSRMREILSGGPDSD